MAKQKSPFHQLLIDNGLSDDALKSVLEAHEAAIQETNDSKELEITKLKADHESALKEVNDLNAGVITTLTAEKSALEEKVTELSSKIEQTERITPGTYTAKNRKKYKFQDGILEFVFARNGSSTAETFVTKEALNDKALMEELISIGAGFIEEIEKVVES